MQNNKKTPTKSCPTNFELCMQMQEALKPFLYVKKVKKKETLLTEGYICKTIYFVRKGAVKQYYLSDGKEFIQNLIDSFEEKRNERIKVLGKEQNQQFGSQLESLSENFPDIFSLIPAKLPPAATCLKMLSDFFFINDKKMFFFDQNLKWRLKLLF